MPVVPTLKPDGPKIRTLREERGITATQFARAIGRSRQSIFNIEGSSTNTSVVFMHQIANALGVDVGEITAADEPAGTEAA